MYGRNTFSDCYCYYFGTFVVLTFMFVFVFSLLYRVKWWDSKWKYKIKKPKRKMYKNVWDQSQYDVCTKLKGWEENLLLKQGW